MNRIANYDTLDYDYSTYWKKREYEHKAEVIVLEKLLKDCRGNFFLDVGGSFGRVMPTYYSKYNIPVIVDYSLKTLQKNYNHIKKVYPNAQLISANAYHLPFKDSSFDGSLMVRVLHHIERPTEYIEEMYRVLAPKGVYIQEFANKLHLKAILRGILKLDFSIFNSKPYQQPKRDNNEGARANADVPFYNYHTTWLKTLFLNTGLTIKKKYGCSFLRIGILKRTFSTNFLLFWERVFQSTLSWLNISPSIFLKSIKDTKGKKSKYTKLEDILVCPKCKGDLDIDRDTAICKECKKKYLKEKNIWDFRV